MGPLISDKTRYTPKNSQRFNGPCGFDLTHVFGFKAKGCKNIRHCFLCAVIVPTNKHRGLATGKFWFIHKGIADTIKSFYQFCAGNDFCKSSISDLSRLVKNFRTPFSGGALAMGLVVSMTTLLEKFSWPA